MRPDKYSEHMCLAEMFFPKKQLDLPIATVPVFIQATTGFVWTRRLANMSSFRKPGAKNGLVL